MIEISENKSNPLLKFSLDIFTGYLHLFLNIGLNLILFPLILHRLGAASLGFFSLSLYFANLSGFAIAWTGGPLILLGGKSLAQKDGRYPLISSTGRGLFLIYGGAVALLLFLLTPWLSIKLLDSHLSDGELLQKTLQGLAFYLLFNFLLQSELLLLTARVKITDANLIRSGVTLLTGFLFFFTPLGEELSGLFYCFAGGAFVGVLLAKGLQIWDGTSYGVGYQISPAICGELFKKQGFYFFLTGLLFVLFMQCDVYLLKGLGDFESVAYFAMAWKIPETLANLSWRFTDTLQPYIVENFHKPDGKSLLKKYQFFRNALLGGTLLVSGFYFFCGNKILKLWLGHPGIPSQWEDFLWPALALFFMSVTKLDHIVGQATGQIKEIVALQGIEIFAKLGGFFLLYPLMGWKAGMVGYVIVSFPLNFIYVHFSQKSLTT